MKTLALERFAYTPVGTFGRLFLPVGAKPSMFYTVERPWENNKSDVSCIPEGTYNCRRGIFSKKGETFEVLGVPNRTAILFHVGNNEDDFQGCVGLGNGTCGWVQSKQGKEPKWSITSSVMAFQQFMEYLKGEQFFILKITQYKAK